MQAWNDFGQSVIGSDIFTLDSVDVDDATRTLDPHDCTQNYGDAGHVVLLREASQDHWRAMSIPLNVPGVTIRCQNNGLVTEQMTVINTALINDPESLGQIFTHELGHAIGLDHSCNGTPNAPSTASFLSCDGLTDDDPYRQAVMYPLIQPEYDSAPLLRDNDKARGSCMMQSTVQ